GFHNDAIIQRSNFEFFVLCHDEVLSIADLRLWIADFRGRVKRQQANLQSEICNLPIRLHVHTAHASHSTHAAHASSHSTHATHSSHAAVMVVMRPAAGLLLFRDVGD